MESAKRIPPSKFPEAGHRAAPGCRGFRRSGSPRPTPPPGYTLSCRLSERVLLLTLGRSLGAPHQPAPGGKDTPFTGMRITHCREIDPAKAEQFAKTFDCEPVKHFDDMMGRVDGVISGGWTTTFIRHTLKNQRRRLKTEVPATRMEILHW